MRIIFLILMATAVLGLLISEPLPGSGCDPAESWGPIPGKIDSSFPETDFTGQQPDCFKNNWTINPNTPDGKCDIRFAKYHRCRTWETLEPVNQTEFGFGEIHNIFIDDF